MRFALIVLFATAWRTGTLACLLAPSGQAANLRVADAALAQVGVTTIYDPSYVHLRYPGGDVPRERGVCADVVVRAFREIGVDLQQAVHADMAAHFAAYPRMWGLRGADANIDHRRVPNLRTFFQRRGKARELSDGYEPGDVVAWRLPNGLYHIGVVSAARGASDYLVVHNIGYGAKNEDVLRAWTIIGHYRW
ncbi:MAG TPA: DUF1287 domain-containing protein [Thermoanaerobaculia bacterium]|nr:DUF1287 domain-containing protein [Thermoanaerobaculia bacterium]